MAKVLVDTDTGQTLTNKSTTAIAGGLARTFEDRFAQDLWVDDIAVLVPGAGSGAGVANAQGIQSAINAVGLAGGGNLHFKHSVYDIATGLTNIYNNVTLVGCGHGANSASATDYVTAGTALRWTGSAGGVMYDIGPALNSNYGVYGGGVHEIYFEGNVSAGTGVLMRSVKGGRFSMTINNTTTVGLKITLEPSIILDVGDSQFNNFDFLFVAQQDVTSGICVQLDGGTVTATGVGANASLNHFRYLRMIHYNGTGLDLVRCDSNQFIQTQVFRNTLGTGVGVVLHAGTAPSYARSNAFVTLAAGKGGVLSQGTASGTQPAIKNSIGHYNEENGEPVPVVELGSSLHYNMALTKRRISRASTSAAHELHRGSKTATQVLGQYRFVGYNSSDTEVIYGYIDGLIADPTAAAEFGTLRFNVTDTGVASVKVQIKNGVIIGLTPSGSFLGDGTLNILNNYHKDGAAITGDATLTYSVSMAPNLRLGRVQVVTATNNTAFAFAAPTNAVQGLTWHLVLRNTSGGGLGAITPNAIYKIGSAWPSPATGMSATMTFYYNGTNHVEIGRTNADVSN